MLVDSLIEREICANVWQIRHLFVHKTLLLSVIMDACPHVRKSLYLTQGLNCWLQDDFLYKSLFGILRETDTPWFFGQHYCASTLRTIVSHACFHLSCKQIANLLHEEINRQPCRSFLMHYLFSMYIGERTSFYRLSEWLTRALKQGTDPKLNPLIVRFLSDLDRNCEKLFFGRVLLRTEPPNWHSIVRQYIYTLPCATSSYWDQEPYFFVHIPKTAGTSLNAMMSEFCCHGHVLGKSYPMRIRHKLKTIVRNPYDRLVSAYFFMIKGGFNHNDRYLYIGKNYPTFEQWILQDEFFGTDLYLHPNRPMGCMEPTFQQAAWLLDNSNEMVIPLENIGRFETLREDCQRLFNLQITDHLNKTDHDRWQTYYTNPLVQQKVYTAYKRDFDLLGYEVEIK
jgi:hypothetical protein